MTLFRHGVLVVAFVAAMIGLAARVIYLGVNEREFLSQQGEARSVRTETIAAHRGAILDRHGEILALSTPVQSAWTDPSRHQFTSTELRAVARALNLSVAELEEKLSPVDSSGSGRGREFAYLKRRLSDAEAKAAQKLDIDGLFFRTEYRRFYPAAEVAAHVVGKTSIDDLGLEGIELAFNTQLNGEPGRRRVLKDRRGRLIDVLDFGEQARFGDDLALALDLRLQYLAYRELKAAVQDQRAASAALVMVDVETGEVLAMVNQPSYNPNEPLRPGYAGQRNIAVTDTFEPGSTVKPFTALAALESNAYRPDTVIDTSPGYFRVGTKLIQDPVDRGSITLAGALAKSSQVAIAKIALELAPEAVLDVLTRAGMARFVGTGLPGEASGRFSGADLSKPINRAVLSYGYGLSASPLQIAQSYLTLATGGIHRPISVLKRTQAPPDQRVFDARTVRSVVDMLEGVTAPDGTAPQAALPRYRVAGKTGTARKLRGGAYVDEQHVALFAGMVPASDPKLVLVVVIDEPGTLRTSGGASAAPVFARVADQALKLLGAPGDARG
ncbi:MAG: penicillin-binding transpeptidase domain-containing protein [Pseudomonadota bacterium]